jgi:predicted regulator of Ras-like GTPase activity (Roadblock/LC7/MglB family)
MLTSLVERASGARGAIFCDHQGESVELVLRDEKLTEYEMKVFGAQLAAVFVDLGTTARERGAGSLSELRVACASGTLLCRTLPDGYYVVLLVGPGARSASAAFELRRTAGEIAGEL